MSGSDPTESLSVQQILNHVEQATKADLDRFISDHLTGACWTVELIDQYVDWIASLQTRVKGITIRVLSYVRLHDSRIPGIGYTCKGFESLPELKERLHRFDGYPIEDIEFHFDLMPFMPVVRIKHTTVITDKDATFDDIANGENT